MQMTWRRGIEAATCNSLRFSVHLALLCILSYGALKAACSLLRRARGQDVYRRTGRWYQTGGSTDELQTCHFESQLERVTASCKTVESWNTRIDTMQDAMAGSTESMYVFVIATLSLIRALPDTVSCATFIAQVPRRESQTTLASSRSRKALVSRWRTT